MSVDDSPLVWVDGSPGNVLPVSDRGVAYGDGVFETIRVSGGKVTLGNYHWARLAQACERLKLPLDIELICSEVVHFLASAGAGSGVLKLMVTRGSGGRGYSPEGCVRPRRVLSLHPLPERDPDPAYSGARVKPCELRLGSSALAGMKHLNRLEQVMARAEWQGGCF
ncbi:MAG: aminotransferase class IV, partial [Endozoicomonas sp.]